jgi:hypothetical protein
MLTRDLIERSRKRHRFADAALVATTTVALTVSLVVAVTVVSIGIARADALGHVARNDGGLMHAATAFLFDDLVGS